MILLLVESAGSLQEERKATMLADFFEASNEQPTSVVDSSSLHG